MIPREPRLPGCDLQPPATSADLPFGEKLKALLHRHGLELEGNSTGRLVWEPPARVFRKAHVTDVELGAYSYVSPNAQISLATIGRYSSIGEQVTIRGGVHPKAWLSSHPFSYRNLFPGQVSYKPPFSFESGGGPTFIGHDVWIGSGAIILPGVRIGNGAVIGAGAVVAEDIPDYAVAVGNPVRIEGYRFDEATVADLRRVRWWQYDLPKHLAGSAAPPLNDPRRMIDYLAAHADSIERIAAKKKMLLREHDQTIIRTVAAEAPLDFSVPAPTA